MRPSIVAAAVFVVAALSWTALRLNASTPEYLTAPHGCGPAPASGGRTVTVFETAMKSGAGGGRTTSRTLGPRESCDARPRKGRAGGFLSSLLTGDVPPPRGRVSVDTSKTYQSIDGFGGAFTEASARTWARMPADAREEVVEKYWGEDGIGYSLGRVHMNSCDFCVASYDFAPVDGDFSLDHFDDGVSHDRAEMIPLMAAAKAATERRGGDFKLFASPWSPPAWLKAPRKKFEPDPDHPSIEFPGNRSMLSSAQPDGLAHDEKAHAAWALYFSKFASAYEAQGLPLWGFTVQNEPEFSAPWEACRYTANSTGAFVRDFLGPRLKSDHPHLKLFVFDHNRDHMVDWARTVYGDAEAAKFVDGVAFHWYAGGLDRTLDGAVGHANVARARDALPKGARLLPSEGCNCPGIGDSDLLRSERYAHDILSDLALGACGWVDWNLLLDHRGGPNHLGNVCDAPMHATDEKFSGVKIQSYYDVIGHFSKHLHPGSERVEISVDGVFFDDRAATRTATRAAVGFELTLHKCQGSPDRPSPRQAWALDDVHDYLEMTDGSFVDKWGDLCAADANTPGVGSLALVNCEYGKEHGDVAVGKFRRDPDSHAVAELKGGLCLGPSPDRPGAEGAQLELQPCDGANRHQRFTHLPSGALVSDADGRCVTAGWPFVQAVAFARPGGDVAVVALNEASHAAEFDLEVDGDVISASLGPHTIQTYVVSPRPAAAAPAPGDDDGAVKLTDDVADDIKQLKAKLGPV